MHYVPLALALLGPISVGNGVWFDASSGQRQTIPAPELPSELDLPDSAGFFHALSVDLNQDSTEEYFVRGLCGTGGCEYVILNSTATSLLGIVTGDPVCLTWSDTSVFPLIESFSHQSAGTGLHRTYTYNGQMYELAASVEIADSTALSLLARFSRFTRLK